ncbi:MAG TPA: metallophosphoesterase family protein [Gemmatimonadota bacterium]|nr:metallophosphoesterase family protein [Gemmatimonadota bacterium]
MHRPIVLALLFLTVSLGLRCAQNAERAALDEPITPPGAVEREPYFVWMTDSSAVIRWRTWQPAGSGIRFWIEADTTELLLEQEGRTHTFQMLQLQPATTYHYEIRLNDTLWSKTADFTTFPVPGSKEPFTFLLMGDTGLHSAPQLALAAHINEETPNFIVHVGDIAYPDGTDREFTVNHFGVYAPVLKRAPLFPALGNHDIRTNFGEPYVEAFDPPGGHESGSPFYYAFTYGNARFISLDTNDEPEHVQRMGFLGDPTSDQYRWLLQQLSDAQSDPGIDWTIVFFHHAPYSASTGFGGHGSHLPTRRALSPLFDDNRVPIAMSGHDHDYQRSRPIRGNTIQEEAQGTVYLVSGGGGGRWTFRGTGTDWFTAKALQINEYVRIQIDHYDLKLEAVDTGGNVFDLYEFSLPEDQRKPAIQPTEPLALPPAPAAEAETEASSAPTSNTTTP